MDRHTARFDASYQSRGLDLDEIFEEIMVKKNGKDGERFFFLVVFFDAIDRSKESMKERCSVSLSIFLSFSLSLFLCALDNVHIHS